MNTSARTVRKPGVSASSFAPAHALLQRKCACGGSSGLAGKCEECKEKQSPLQRKAVERHTDDNSFQHDPQSLAGPRVDASRFGHDFSQVPVHTDAKASPSAQPLFGHGFEEAAVRENDAEREANPDRGPATLNDPRSIVDQLGPGSSFGGSARSRMESAFGQSFSNVRLHTDSKAAQLSTRLNALAFTVGSHVAFASGQYQPGTMVGDALMAHELAHVSQQRNSSPSPAAMEVGGSEYNALERDADTSAAQVVVSLWGRTKAKASGLAESAGPRLRSGLRLSMVGCGGNGPTCEERERRYKKEDLSCEQVCDLAYLNPCFNIGGGGVVCYFGKKCPCVFDQSERFNIKRGECPAVDRIVMVHEKQHVPEGECQDENRVHMLGPPAASDLIKYECPHVIESEKALSEALKDETEPCKSKLTNLRDQMRDYIKVNCGGIEEKPPSEETPPAEEKPPTTQKPAGVQKPAGEEKSKGKPPAGVKKPGTKK